jgi:hypothetical protein
MQNQIRVAIVGSSAFDAEYWGSVISDADLEVIGTVSGNGIEKVIRERIPDVVVLGGEHQPARAARLRSCHPAMKIVGTGSPTWCSDIDAWAGRPEEISTAVLSTFLY